MYIHNNKFQTKKTISFKVYQALFLNKLFRELKKGNKPKKFNTSFKLLLTSTYSSILKKNKIVINIFTIDKMINSDK